MSIQARKCSAAQLLAQIAKWGPERFWRTQSCGPVHKLLPEVSFRVVLSAPTKKSKASIVISTSNYEDRSPCSPNANAFSAFRCGRNRNHANRKGRIRSPLLPDPLFGGPNTHSGQIQSRPGGESALRRDRAISGRTQHSRTQDLFSRSGRRVDLDRRLGRARSFQLSRRKLAGAPGVLRIGL